MGLNVSVGVDVQSGAPLTAFAAHPVYDTGGEIPLTVRGDGFQTSDGFRTRTPWTQPVNAGASYNLKVGTRKSAAARGRVQPVQHADGSRLQQLHRTAVRVPNPDFGAAGVSGVVSGQQFTAPRQVRIGVRYEF